MVEVYFRVKRSSDDLLCEAYDVETFADARKEFKKDFGSDFTIVSLRNPMKEAKAMMKQYRVALRNYYDESHPDFQREEPLKRYRKMLLDEYCISENELYEIEMDVFCES